MNPSHLTYVSYMLRLWLENEQEHEYTARSQGEWRASLEDPHTQEIQVFADLEALFDFLLKETKQRVSSEKARSHEADEANLPA